MSSPCNCECHENDPITNPRMPKTYPDSHSKSDLDKEIRELQLEIEEKMENVQDYSELETKLIKLENDVQNLSEEKLQIEYELRHIGKENDKILSDLEIENDNLINEIKQRNLMIEKLYLNNNNLYSILDNEKNENQNLREKLIEQNEVLKRINNDRKNLENNLNNLSVLKNQDFSDIQNLEEQIDFLTKENINNDNELNKLNELNEKYINAINYEESMRDKLEQIIKDKDNEIEENAHELELTNETLKRLGNDLNNLNIKNNENEENINLCEQDLIKESQIKEDILNKNQQLSDLINEKDMEINKLTNAKNTQTNDLDNIKEDISSLNNNIEQYKQHIINISDMNDILAKELGGIILIDEQMRNDIMNRAEYLKELKEENKNIINLSLNNLTNYMKNNGNKGCYIKAEKKNEEKNLNKNKMINKEINKNKNKYYSFKDKENENFFTVNGAKIIKSNTLKENKIKYSDIIMMIPLED